MRTAFAEHLPRADSSSRREPIETPPRLTRFGIFVFPPAADPIGVLESVQDAVHGGAGSLRRLHDGPAVQVARVAVERPEQDLKDVEQRIRDPHRTSHDTYLI
jgi:hypothetical protein